MRRLHLFCAYLSILLGIAHLSFTPRNYGGLSLDAIWFASAGLAILFGGFLNLTFVRSAAPEPILRWLCFAANLLLAFFFLLAIPLLREPQVFFGAGLFAFEAFAVAYHKKT
jgi:hypothetical protein